ncbi:Hypothetical protein FKW44_014282 [Caligus rogercresseyi]|uniref:Uncharacterized protein n=1 Tax=Caligus rogercresseyi TaxID=217165 RepID=A0A7T8JYV4_CALRO|nr:Hypothetical protein FKW44_014282 [Caligus rogercresseyi]
MMTIVPRSLCKSPFPSNLPFMMVARMSSGLMMVHRRSFVVTANTLSATWLITSIMSLSSKA